MSEEPAQRAASATPGRRTAKDVALVGVASWAVIQGIGAVLATNATGSVVLQALAAEVGAGRAGVAWSYGKARRLARRIVEGSGVAAVPVVAIVGLGAMTGGLRVAAATSPSIATLLLGAAVATAAAVRDELILRGVLLRAFGGLMGAPLLYLVAGVVGAAGCQSAAVWELAARFAWGVFATALWRRDRGAVMACAAHATLHFSLGPLLAGGLADVQTVKAAFSGAGGMASSPVAAGILALAAAALAFATERRRAAS